MTDADDGTEDSQRTGDLPITVLKGNHEMLILAQEAKAGTQSNSTEPYIDYNWAYVCGTNIKNIDTPNTAQQKYYDLVKARDYADLNAGLKRAWRCNGKGYDLGRYGLQRYPGQWRKGQERRFCHSGTVSL